MTNRIMMLILIALCSLLACSDQSEPTTTVVVELDTTDPEVRQQVADVIEERLRLAGVVEPARINEDPADWLLAPKLKIVPVGDDRLEITVVGATDHKRIADLACRSAELAFTFVRGQELWESQLAAVDAHLAAADPDAGDRQLSDLLLPASSALYTGYPALLVATADVAAAREMIERSRAALTETELWLSAEPGPTSSGVEAFGLFLLDSDPILTGDDIAEAQARPDMNLPGNWCIAVELTPRGGEVFAHATGQNVGLFVAICLDGRVHSAPRIQGAIPGGQAVIEGKFTVTEARELALMLNAGALPVGVRVVEARVE